MSNVRKIKNYSKDIDRLENNEECVIDLEREMPYRRVYGDFYSRFLERQGISLPPMMV